MSDLTSLFAILTWIAEWITLQGTEATWITDPEILIAKASLTYVSKFWWLVVHSRLRPIGNDNMLQPSQAYLVACLVAKYGLNIGRIIAIEI